MVSHFILPLAPLRITSEIDSFVLMEYSLSSILMPVNASRTRLA